MRHPSATVLVLAAAAGSAFLVSSTTPSDYRATAVVPLAAGPSKYADPIARAAVRALAARQGVALRVVSIRARPDVVAVAVAATADAAGALSTNAVVEFFYAGSEAPGAAQLTERASTRAKVSVHTQRVDPPRPVRDAALALLGGLVVALAVGTGLDSLGRRRPLLRQRGER